MAAAPAESSESDDDALALAADLLVRGSVTKKFSNLEEAHSWMRTQPPLTRLRGVEKGSGAVAAFDAKDEATWTAAPPQPGKVHRQNAFVCRVQYACSRRAAKSNVERETVARLDAARVAGDSRASLLALEVENERRRVKGGHSVAMQARVHVVLNMIGCHIRSIFA